jgi:hypothetical protein
VPKHTQGIFYGKQKISLLTFGGVDVVDLFASVDVRLLNLSEFSVNE